MDEVQLPRITSGVDPQVVAVLQQLAAQLGKVAESTDRTASAAEAQEGAFGRMGEKVKAVVGDLRGMAETAASVLSTIGELSAEQGRLDRSSSALGLSFQQATVAAGRYVDQLVIQRAAESAAQTGLRLTQEELDALTRRAAQYAQATGTDMTEAVNQLTEAVVKGEQEGLQRFGGGLAEVGRQGGTAGERLRALVVDATATARATDDAATASARLAGELRQAGREASAAFTERLAENLNSLSSSLDTSATRAEDLKTSMRALGSIGADTLTVLGGVALGVIGLIGTPIAAVIDGVRYLRSAMTGGPTTGDPLENARAMVASNMAALDMIRRGAAGIAGGGDRGDTEPPPSRGSGVMEFSLEDVQARGRRTGGGSSAGGAANDNAGAAAGQDALSSAADGLLASMIARARRGAADIQRSLSDRSINAEMGNRRADVLGRADAGTVERSNAAKLRAQEERDRERDIRRERSLTDQLEEQFTRRTTLAQEMATGIRSAYDKMASGAGAAYAAIVKGGDDLGATLRQILSDTLLSIGQEAAVKALLNVAEGLAAVATYRYDAAASHFAAAGVYGAVAVAAGIGASVAAPGGQTAAAGGVAPQRPTQSGREATGGNGGGPTVVNNFYNAPVIDGRTSTRAEVGTEMRHGYLDRDARRTQGARRAA